MEEFLAHWQQCVKLEEVKRLRGRLSPTGLTTFQSTLERENKRLTRVTGFSSSQQSSGEIAGWLRLCDSPFRISWQRWERDLIMFSFLPGWNRSTTSPFIPKPSPAQAALTFHIIQKMPLFVYRPNQNQLLSNSECQGRIRSTEDVLLSLFEEDDSRPSCFSKDLLNINSDF